MSKLAHSNDETMVEIDRNAAREAGELRRCSICEAENISDDPVCPRGGIGCEIETVAPTMGIEP
jgi:hypothetical protein